jgi:tryptophanyl-tRNA synthetase
MPDDVAQKIKKAQTAAPGEMPDVLESHFIVANLLASDDSQRDELLQLKQAHLNGDAVMGRFKNQLTDIVNDFLGELRERNQSISVDYVREVLISGGEKVKEETDSVIDSVKDALGFKSLL